MRNGWAYFRILLAFVLAIGAIAKFLNMTEILSGNGLLSNRWLLTLAIGVEAGVAVFLLLSNTFWSWAVTAILFLIFFRYFDVYNCQRAGLQLHLAENQSENDVAIRPDVTCNLTLGQASCRFLLEQTIDVSIRWQPRRGSFGRRSGDVLRSCGKE